MVTMMSGRTLSSAFRSMKGNDVLCTGYICFVTVAATPLVSSRNLVAPMETFRVSIQPCITFPTGHLCLLLLSTH